MKKIVFLLPIILFCVACPEKETPYFSHVYGRLRLQNGSTYFDNVILQVSDLNPDDPDRFRIREVTTATIDSLPGSFELDSVCYGTSAFMNSEIVSVYSDSIDNPAFPSQLWYPAINGRNGVDTILLYIHY